MLKFIKKYKLIFVILLILLTVAIAVTEQLDANSSARLVITELSGKKPERFEILRRIDSVPISLQPHGNLFFSFKHFQDWDDNGINTTALIFQRTAYNIYPLLLYGDAGNFTPFDAERKKQQTVFSMNEWIRQKNISHTVYYLQNPDKSVAMNVVQHIRMKPVIRYKPGAMIISLSIIISLICTGAFGLFLSSFIFQRTTRIEFISVALLTGIGCSALVIQSLSMLGILPSSTMIGVLGVCGVLGVYIRRDNIKKIVTESSPLNIDEKRRTVKFAKLSLFIILLSVVIIIFFNAFILPLYAWDGFMIWLLKAKVLIHESLAETSFFTNRNYGFAHLKYPLLLPFIYASYSLFAGGFNLYCARSPEFFIFISGALLFYHIFKKESKSSIFSLLLMLSMFSSPVFLINCGVGVADAALSIFYFASIYYQFCFFRDQKRQDIVLAIIFTTLCAMTKNEGIALFGISAVLFSLFSIVLKPGKVSIKNSLIFVLSTTILLLPYFLWSSSVPATDENYPQHLSALFTFEKISLIPTIFYKFISTMFSLKFLPATTVAIFALFIADITFFRSQLFWTRFIYFIAHLCLYIFVFAITPWNLSFLYNTALDRVILHLIPPLLLMAATAYGYALSENGAKKQNLKIEK